jgi:hypothetical protein
VANSQASADAGSAFGPAVDGRSFLAVRTLRFRPGQRLGPVFALVASIIADENVHSVTQIKRDTPVVVQTFQIFIDMGYSLCFLL